MLKTPNHPSSFRKFLFFATVTFDNTNSQIGNISRFEFIASWHSTVSIPVAHEGPGFLGWHRIFMIMQVYNISFLAFVGGRMYGVGGRENIFHITLIQLKCIVYDLEYNYISHHILPL